MKNSKFGDTVASEMEQILSNENFKSIFSSSNVEKVDLTSEFSSTYKPFVRTASDKKDRSEILKSVISSLSEISQELDDIGLEKSASATLFILDRMIKEASDWSEDSVPRPGETFNYDLDVFDNNIYGDNVDEDFLLETMKKLKSSSGDTKRAFFDLLKEYPDSDIPSAVPKFTSDKGFAKDKDDKSKEKEDLDKMLDDVNKELQKIQEEGPVTKDVLKDEHKADSCMVDDCKSCDEHSASFLEMEPKPPTPPTFPGGPIGSPPAEPLMVTDEKVIEAYNKILKMIK